MRWGLRSVTAVFTNPSNDYSWTGRLICAASSTTAELVAITEAMTSLTTTPDGHSVISWDSHVAPTVQTVVTTIRSRLVLRQLAQLAHIVVMQRITGRTGISGDVQADRLAEAAHRHLTRMDVTQDPRLLLMDSWRTMYWLTTNGRIFPCMDSNVVTLPY